MAEKEAKKSLKDIIKQINKTCKEWDILSSGNFSKNLKKLSLRSLGFDYPFKGGLPYGQITTISGVEHSGKSTIAAIAMGEYQQENPDKKYTTVCNNEYIWSSKTSLPGWNYTGNKRQIN